MTDALIITPAQRFAQLRAQFRSLLVTSRARKRLSATQAHHISKAAALQQTIEVAILERALGAKHDRMFIEQLKSAVKQHLALAGARNPGGKQ
jgi:hypothetical protein